MVTLTESRVTLKSADAAKLPDNAKVCLPPAATVDILTPGLSVTRQGKAERVSSLAEELSAVCLADETRLRFTDSSPAPLLSTAVPDPLPLAFLEPRGLTAKIHL